MLEQHCPSTHLHEPLLGGRAKAAQVYPPKLCTRIVSGFATQLKLDTTPTPPNSVGTTGPNSGGEECDRAKSEARASNLEVLQVDAEDTDCRSHPAELCGLEDDLVIAENDVHGESLPAHLVLAARQN